MRALCSTQLSRKGWHGASSFIPDLQQLGHMGFGETNKKKTSFLSQVRLRKKCAVSSPGGKSDFGKRRRFGGRVEVMKEALRRRVDLDNTSL